ncbi:MAG TPA: hypothetical protein VHJ59_09535 [Nitrososphaera sp.]|nr:hypothetical protein [Nitrososphaera sp.]
MNNPYEVYRIKKKKFLAFQLLPATNIPNAYTHVVDVMRWIANARRKSKFAS